MKLLQPMSSKEYHARTEISASMIKKCDPPARLKYAMDHKDEPSDAQNLGTAIHESVFTGAHNFAVREAGMDFRTNAGKAWRDAQKAAGKSILTADENDIVWGCRAAVKNHADAVGILSEGDTDIACVVTDPDLRTDCRCLYDWVPLHLMQLVDLKTTSKGNAAPEKFAREIVKHGYHLQAAWYLRLWNLYHERDEDKRTEFAFIVVETEAPFLVAVHRLSSEFLAAAEIECLRRAEMIRDCRESGIWPAYPGVNLIDKPRWMKTDLESLIFE